MNLSGQQRKNLLVALNDAFRDKALLEQMLAFELDKNLDTIAGGNNLQEIAFNLIKTAEAQAWVEDLVFAARKSNPGNLKLRAIAEELFPIQSPEPHKIPSPNIPQEQSTQTRKILILTAIPQGLRLDKEIREIEEAIQRATNRDLFEIKIRTAVRPQDIRRAIAEERPSIVHFCGHGLEDGSLLLEDEVGNHKPVSPRGLVSLFRLHAERVKCVLLNACYSSKSAEAISQHVKYVIGMNQPIQDRAAIVFAQGFYDGLGYDNIDELDVIQRAFDEGIVAIELENLLQGIIPSMWKLGVAQSPIELTIQLRDSSSNLQREVPISTRRPNDDESQSVSALEYTRGNGADDDLSSDRAIDYIRLRDLLRAGNWKDADYETYLVMLKVVGRLDGDWIRDEELLNFPCTDLHTIDSLWVKYSNGRFGFSVQKKIYLCVGGVPDGRYYKEAWEKFGDRVGWRVKENWIYYEDVIFNTTAPYGHLPPGDGVDTEGRRRVWGAVWKSLLSHRDL